MLLKRVSATSSSAELSHGPLTSPGYSRQRAALGTGARGSKIGVDRIRTGDRWNPRGRSWRRDRLPSLAKYPAGGLHRSLHVLRRVGIRSDAISADTRLRQLSGAGARFLRAARSLDHPGADNHVVGNGI